MLQDKVKQRNITPNFLRFRSNSIFTQEKVRPIRLVKRLLEMTGLNHSLPLKELIEAHLKLVDVASKLINQESFISANSVFFMSLRKSNKSSC